MRFAAIAAVTAAIIAGFPQRLFHRAEALKPVASRPAMPDFGLPQLGGGEWRLAEHKGKVILVNFWATWCGPCQRETPELVALDERYRARGFAVVGITLDEDAAKVVPAFVRRYRIPYPILAPHSAFTLAEEIDSLPTTLLLDRSGRLAKTYIGEIDANDVAADIERLLSESSEG